MKKLILPAVILVLFSFLCGCAGPRGYMDQGPPASLPVLGGGGGGSALSAPPETFESAVISSRVPGTGGYPEYAADHQFRSDYGPEDSGEEYEETAGYAGKEPEIGRPEAGIFRDYGRGEKIGEYAREKRDKEKTYRPPPDRRQKYGWRENEWGVLKDRVSRLEEIVGYHHSGSEAGSVYFKPADACLSPATKKWLDEKINRWYGGEIDILAINGYASTAKSRNPGMTNMDYARERAEAVIAYLEARGVKTDDIAVGIRGETSRFSNNLNVTLVWEEVEDEDEQEQRKGERTGNKKTGKNKRQSL